MVAADRVIFTVVVRRVPGTQIMGLSGAIVKTCGSRSLGSFWRGVLCGPLDELAAGEGRSGADQGDEVGCVDGAPAVLC